MQCRKGGFPASGGCEDAVMGLMVSGLPEHAKWSPVLREFLAPLVARLN